jgi:hypothetical protein
MFRLAAAAADSSHTGHSSAKRIVDRGHYRVFYERNPNDAAKNPEAGEAIFNAATEEYSADKLHHDRYTQKRSGTVFPVKSRDDRIVSSLAVSDVLKRVPLVNIDYVFVDPEIEADAKRWLDASRDSIITSVQEDEE